MESEKKYTVPEAADIIMAHLIECKRPCDERRIQKEVFPKMTLDHIQHILDYIKFFPVNGKVITIHNYADGGLKATALAADLLEQGGFVKLQNDLDAVGKRDNTLKERQMQLSDLQIADLVDKVVQNPKVNARARRIEFWTVASIILAIIAIIISLVKKQQ